MPRRHRWRWGLTGLLIGVVYVLADTLLEWRGQRYLPWSGTEAIVQNIAQMATGAAIFFLVAFALGYAKDRAVIRKAAAPNTLPPANDSVDASEWYLFVDEVEYGPLSTAQLVAYAETHGLSDAHVWRQGVKEWTQPGDISELTVALRKGPDAKQAGQRGNWIARHWRGDLPLWVSYWVISFAVNLTIPAIAAGAGLLFRSDSYQPLRSFATIVVIWLTALLVTTWQLVGVWRSARHYRADRVRDGKWGFWSGAAQAAVILGAVLSAGSFVKDGIPQLNEVYAIAFKGDPEIPDYSIVAGKTEAETIAGMRAQLAPFIRSRIPEADDDVVVEFYRVLIDQLKALRAKNPAWCYQYAFGADANFHHEMPTSLQRREGSMQERAIRTAAKRPPVSEDAANPGIIKVFSRMTQSGATDDDIALLESDQVESAQQPRYCELSITFYEEIEKLPTSEAVAVMRFLLEAK